MSTFGPAFNEKKDGDRIRQQMQAIHNLCSDGIWRTLGVISKALGYPEASVSAQLRHLRKEKFGAFVVKKRRVTETGLWEYQLLDPDPHQLPAHDPKLDQIYKLKEEIRELKARVETLEEENSLLRAPENAQLSLKV